MFQPQLTAQEPLIQWCEPCRCFALRTSLAMEVPKTISKRFVAKLNHKKTQFACCVCRHQVAAFKSHDCKNELCTVSFIREMVMVFHNRSDLGLADFFFAVSISTTSFFRNREVILPRYLPSLGGHLQATGYVPDPWHAQWRLQTGGRQRLAVCGSGRFCPNQPSAGCLRHHGDRLRRRQNNVLVLLQFMYVSWCTFPSLVFTCFVLLH